MKEKERERKKIDILEEKMFKEITEIRKKEFSLLPPPGHTCLIKPRHTCALPGV